MRLLLLVVTIGACAMDGAGVTEVESNVIIKGNDCPDIRNCDEGNGGGVYTDENGFVGIGPNQFLITHLINVVDSTGTKHVNLAGRYYSASDGYWRAGTGQVTGAHYQNEWYSVEELNESFTVPKFTLSRSGITRDVTGPDIQYNNGLGLVLHVSLDDGTGEYDLSWGNYSSEPGNNVVVRKAYMRWQSQKQGTTWTQYCRMADGTPDPIVFQQGIGVHPVTADLIYDSAYVTPGCRHGGPATVRLWGYSYRNNTSTADQFKAALHMKRASYCGDRSFYTKSGTEILIWDDFPVNQQFDTSTNVTSLEAAWGPNGATCVNLGYVRHGDVEYPAGHYFDGYCPDANGVLHRIPNCVPALVAAAHLASKAETPCPGPSSCP
jgi:hypothetical protein